MDGATFLWHIYFLSLAGIDRYMSVNPAAPKNGFLPMLLYILEMHWVIHTFLCQVYQWRRAVAADRRKAGESVSAPPPNRLFFSDVSREKLRFGAGTDVGIRSAGCAGSF